MEQSKIDDLRRDWRFVNGFVFLWIAMSLAGVIIEQHARERDIAELDRKITAIERSHWSSKSIEGGPVGSVLTGNATTGEWQWSTASTAVRPLPLPRCYPCPAVRAK